MEDCLQKFVRNWHVQIVQVLQVPVAVPESQVSVQVPVLESQVTVPVPESPESQVQVAVPVLENGT